MITVGNLDEWVKDYFADSDNQKKAEKACERYDRLMMKQIRKQLSSGSEQIELSVLVENDTSKSLEKAKYEYISSVQLGEKVGKIRIDLLNRSAEFIEK